MRQSAFTIFTDVRDRAAAEALRDLLDGYGDRIGSDESFPFGTFEDLHYATFVAIPDVGGHPKLLFEGNVDGTAAAFLEKLVRRAPDAVDTIYRHCVDYPAAGAADVAAVVAYLRSHDVGARTFFVAWPGFSVDDVHREQRLRDEIEAFLDAPEQAGLRDLPPEEIHRRIREHVGSNDTLRWAQSPPPSEFFVRYGPRLFTLLVAPLAVALVGLLLGAIRRRPSRHRTRSRLGLAAVVTVVGGAVAELWSAERGDDRRDLERDWQSQYAVGIAALGAVRRREDVQVQNHMISVTRVKAGWFRLQVLRLVLWAINLFARLRANRGSLGGIDSIHFARWVLTPDRKHLVFLSNFDGSWERYLNDFIDLAAIGLTAVWTNSDNHVGFPTTKWLLTKGARDEARFKAYARSSMVPSNTWYSAYPNLTVRNIENNRRLRQELCTTLDRPDAEAWLRRL